MILFSEKQKFTQWWVWIIVVIIGVIPIVGLYVQIVLEVPFGNNPMSNTGLVVMALLLFALLAFLLSVSLYVVVDAEKIRIRYSILANKTVYWRDVEKAEIVDYGFVGYGLRYSPFYGKVLNVKGRMGLAIQKRNGKKLVIGTQRPDELGKVAQQCLLAQQVEE